MSPSFLVILAVSVIWFLIGIARYSPYMFGHLRRTFSGVKLKDVHPAHTNLRRLYLLSFMMLLIKTYVLAHFIIYLANSLGTALQTWFRLRLGFVMTTQLSEILRSTYPRLGVFLLNATHQLVVMLLSAWLLFLWL